MSDGVSEMDGMGASPRGGADQTDEAGGADEAGGGFSAPGRRALARRDIAEVRHQQAEGEMDGETAERLVRRYRGEIDRLGREGGEVGEGGEAAGGGRGAAGGRPRLRRLAGALLLTALFAGAAAGAFSAVQNREGGFITGGGGGGGGPVDLSEVTNDQMEAVIAANPDAPEIAAMRLALADRYFEEGLFSSALPHYLGALDGRLDRGRRARGMARVGWMSHLSGAGEPAEAYLARALEIDPDYLEAGLFLGLVRFDRGDPAGALARLEPLLAEEGLPEGARRTIEETVRAARTRLEEGP